VKRPLGGGVAPLDHEVKDVMPAPDESDLEREWQIRKYFPHLSASVAPRESDEYPTCVEE
jgi:hypothetical protein